MEKSRSCGLENVSCCEIELVFLKFHENYSNQWRRRGAWRACRYVASAVAARLAMVDVIINNAVRQTCVISIQNIKVSDFGRIRVIWTSRVQIPDGTWVSYSVWIRCRLMIYWCWLVWSQKNQSINQSHQIYWKPFSTCSVLHQFLEIILHLFCFYTVHLCFTIKKWELQNNEHASGENRRHQTKPPILTGDVSFEQVWKLQREYSRISLPKTPRHIRLVVNHETQLVYMENQNWCNWAEITKQK